MMTVDIHGIRAAEALAINEAQRRAFATLEPQARTLRFVARVRSGSSGTGRGGQPMGRYFVILRTFGAGSDDGFAVGVIGPGGSIHWTDETPAAFFAQQGLHI